MFTANDLAENSTIEPYQALPDHANNSLSDEEESTCCSCIEACQCVGVNTQAGAILGAGLGGALGGLIGACCIAPTLVLCDFCCFPPTENHDCAGRMCKICGVAAAIPGVPVALGGAIAMGTVGLATGLLCAPIAFFGAKPKCYDGASTGMNEAIQGVYNEIMGNESEVGPVAQVMR